MNNFLPRHVCDLKTGKAAKLTRFEISATNEVKGKGKVYPCTGIGALYRPYGKVHRCTGTEALYRPYGKVHRCTDSDSRYRPEGGRPPCRDRE
jgi:hypothetical protein